MGVGNGPGRRSAITRGLTARTITSLEGATSALVGKLWIPASLIEAASAAA